MATLASRIDTVTNNISTAKTNLKTAIINKGGNVSSDSPTFEELKKGIEGISTGTTIDYEEYYPNLSEISGIRNIGSLLSSFPSIDSPLFYISYLGGIFYGHCYSSSDNRCFVKYNWSSNITTILYSFNSLLQSNYDPMYSESDGSINIIPYDSNVDNITSPNLKYYFCQGNSLSGGSYSSSKGVYSYDLVTNTASLLAKFNHYNNSFFNRINSEGNIDKEYLYAISIYSPCCISKMNKSTFVISLINSSDFWTSDQTLRDWWGGSPFVYPWIEDKVYAQILFRNSGSTEYKRSGSYSFLTDTFSLIGSGRYSSCYIQLPLLLRKGSWWGKSINLSNYVLNDNSLSIVPYLECSSGSYPLLSIYGLPFLCLRSKSFYATCYYLLPITNGQICECKFNQKVFQIHKKDIWTFSDVEITHPKNTTFVTEEGYSYIIIEGPITGYIKYL